MLEINNLHVKLEDENREIIRGLTLAVKPGEVHAIMGPNGSGKSTLSYVLAGREGWVAGPHLNLYNPKSLAMILAICLSSRMAVDRFLSREGS